MALAVTQLLASGMTSPLRQMTDVARQMARGDYSGRVHATSSDEVGQLARAFNKMAEDLATVDRQRRDLVANVSHELRTPLTALCAVLENLVDGVAEPDPAGLQAALDQAERLGRLVEDLLDLSRVDAGVTPLQLRPVPVADLLERAVAEAAVGPHAVEYDVRIDSHRPRGQRGPRPAAAARRQPARQRVPAQPLGRNRPRLRHRDRQRLVARGRRRGTGHRSREPGARLRAFRHPRRPDRRPDRRDRPRPGDRPLGHRPAPRGPSDSSTPSRARPGRGSAPYSLSTNLPRRRALPRSPRSPRRRPCPATDTSQADSVPLHRSRRRSPRPRP